MSAKRAKSEIKQESNSNSQLGSLFHKYDLVGYICAFVPNTQLPNVKATTKEAVRAIDKHEPLAERWQRGVLENYRQYEWVYNRAGLVNGIGAKKVLIDFFLVCWECHGISDRREPSRWTNRWLATMDPTTQRCVACKEREDLTNEARNGNIKDVAKEIKATRAFIQIIDKGMEADRIAVYHQKLYDPIRHMESLRTCFPDLDTDDESDESESSTWDAD